MKYRDELTRAMTWLGEQDKTLFLGQSVEFEGTGMFGTLKGVSLSKRREMPVAENMQIGISLGLAVAGYVPVNIIPRWNFLILAMDQIVNHIDKLPLMSDYRPKVIIRTSIGSERPLHPQLQHVGDFTDAVASMCKTVKVVRLDEPQDIFPAYVDAFASTGSTILVEYGDYHTEK